MMEKLTELGLKDLIKETLKSLRKIDTKTIPSGKKLYDEGCTYSIKDLRSELQNSGACISNDVHSDIREIIAKIRTSKPTLNSKHSSTEVQEYSVKLREYEALKRKQDEIDKLEKSIGKKINAAEEDWVKSYCGLDSIPEKYQAKVWGLAWSRGHGCGMNEVKCELESLVEIFE